MSSLDTKFSIPATNSIFWNKPTTKKLIPLILLFVLPILIYLVIDWLDLVGMPDGDVYLYHRISTQFVQGQHPFIDYFYEYPPVSIFFLSLPALFTTSINSYISLYQLLSWAVMVLIVFLSNKLAKLFNYNDTERHKLVLTGGVVSALLMVLAINRFDTFAAGLTFAGLVLYLQGVAKSTLTIRILGSLLIIIAVFVKLYPVFFLPFIGLYEIKLSKPKEVIWSGIAGLIFCIPFMSWFLAGQEGVSFFLEYHTKRFLEVESTWASTVLLWDRLTGGNHYAITYEYASLNLRGYLPDQLSLISLKIFACVLVITLLAFVIKVTKQNALSMLMHAFVLSVAGFAVFNKVFSAQYVIWFLPLFPLYLTIVFSSPELTSFKGKTVIKERGKTIPQAYTLMQNFINPLGYAALLSVLLSLFTVIIYPLAWGSYIDGNLILTFILVIRNCMLLVIVLSALIFLLPTKSEFEDFLKYLKDNLNQFN